MKLVRQREAPDAINTAENEISADPRCTRRSQAVHTTNK